VTNEKLKFFGIADKEFAPYICITLYFFIFFLKWNCLSSVEKEGTIAVGQFRFGNRLAGRKAKRKKVTQQANPLAWSRKEDKQRNKRAKHCLLIYLISYLYQVHSLEWSFL
jgi:hypothetical protein